LLIAQFVELDCKFARNKKNKHRAMKHLFSGKKSTIKVSYFRITFLNNEQSDYCISSMVHLLIQMQLSAEIYTVSTGSEKVLLP
jgi:hypothetical protein